MKYLLLFLLMLSGVLPALSATDDLRVAEHDENFAGQVVVIKVGKDSLVNQYSFKYWRKILKKADEQQAKAIVFDIDTPGGYAAETAELITRVIPEVSVPTIAYVNLDATSAGSMVAFGCDKIYMHPRGTIGSTGIVAGGGQEIGDVMRAKIESLFESYVKIVAKEKGRNPDVMRAMMFKDLEFDFGDGQVVVEKGRLLNLTADEAVLIIDGKPLLADGISSDLAALLEAEGLSEANVVLAKPTGMDAFANWVGLMSPLLISVGLIALFLELKTPGVGIFGAISLGAFSLFFIGNNMDGNMSGAWLAVIFLLGLLLVILEFTVIPGTFFAGSIGCVMMLGALMIAMVDEDLLDSFRDGSSEIIGFTMVFGWPLVYLSISLLVATILALVLLRFLPSMPMYHALAVDDRLESGTGLESATGLADLLGKQGTCVTAMRPAGKIEVEGKLYDAQAECGFLDQGTTVAVISVDGVRILVEQAS